jgi:hypothetical protein
MSSPEAMPLQDNRYITNNVVERSQVSVVTVMLDFIVKEVVKAHKLGN